MSKTKIFVESSALLPSRPSGIGKLVGNTLQALTKNTEFQSKYELVLFGVSRPSKLYGATFKRLPSPSRRAANALTYAKLMPNIDTYLGRGMYLFLNFIKYPTSKKSKSVFWVHDLSYERYPDTVAPKLQKHLHKHVPNWINKSDKIIAISDFTSSEIQEYYGTKKDKISIVYAGVDQKVFYKRPMQEIESVKTKYGLPQKYLLFVGNLEPRKNLARLIEAFTLAHSKKDSTVALVIIGGNVWKSSELADALQKAHDNNVPIVTPEAYINDEELPAIMSGAIALIHPALYEGFGMTPLEASACGTLVVASDIPPIRQTMEDNAIYVDPLNTQSIADGISSAMKTTQVDKKRHTVYEYNWDNAAKQLLGVIDSLSDTI